MAESEEFKKASEGTVLVRVVVCRVRKRSPHITCVVSCPLSAVHPCTEQAKQGDPMTAFKQMMGMEAKPESGDAL